MIFLKQDCKTTFTAIFIKYLAYFHKTKSDYEFPETFLTARLSKFCIDKSGSSIFVFFNK